LNPAGPHHPGDPVNGDERVGPGRSPKENGEISVSLIFFTTFVTSHIFAELMLTGYIVNNRHKKIRMIQPSSRLSRIQLPMYLMTILAVIALVIFERKSSSSYRSVVLKQPRETIVLTKKNPRQVNIMRAIKQDEVSYTLFNPSM
jgi:hypothetical protein